VGSRLFVASRRARDILSSDRSWTIRLATEVTDATVAKTKVVWVPSSYRRRHHVAGLILVPGSG
jgi:hypothetical protein